MNKQAVGTLLGVLMAGFALASCGDDDDKPAPVATGAQGGGSNTGGTKAGGQGNGGQATDPFAGVTCPAPSSDTCGTLICTTKSAYDQLASACQSNPSAQCTKYQNCASTYVKCLNDACPGGTLDSNKATTCASDYSTCIQ